MADLAPPEERAALPSGIRLRVELFFKDPVSGAPFRIDVPALVLPSAEDLAGSVRDVLAALRPELKDKVVLDGDFVFMTEDEVDAYLEQEALGGIFGDEEGGDHG